VPGRAVAVVVTHQRLALLRQSLGAVLGQSRAPDAVVVVDNASTDGTAAVVAAEFPDVDLVVLQHNTGGAGGFATGMQRALEQHRADLLWVLDDDTGALRGRARAPRGGVGAAAGGAAGPRRQPRRLDGRPGPPDEHASAGPPAPPGRAGRAAAAGCVPVRSASFVSVLLDAPARPRRRAAGGRLLPLERRLRVHDPPAAGPPAGCCARTAWWSTARAVRRQRGRPGARFYYEVRNKVWLFTRSPGLRPVERALYAGSTLARWARTVRASADRRTLRRAARRGLRDGLRAGPRPNAEVLAAACRPVARR
jgi:hypothetical protein